MDQIAYVNGSYMPLSEAKVSILDRGFLFADGIYEVAAVLDGKLIDNASHLARLQRSVGEIALQLPETTDRIQEIQRELIARKRLVIGPGLPSPIAVPSIDTTGCTNSVALVIKASFAARAS